MKKYIIPISALAFLGVLYFSFSTYKSYKELKRSEDTAQLEKGENVNRTIASIGGSRGALKDDEQFSPLDMKESQNGMNSDTLMKVKEAILKKENKIVSFNNNKYIVVKDLVAVNREDFNSSLGKKIQSIASSIIYLPNEGAERPKSQMLVVLNTNNNQLQIIPGTFAVKVDSKNKLQNILNSYPVELTYSADHLNIYYLKPKNIDGIFEMVKNVKGTKGVSDVDIDILQGTIKAL